MILFLIFAAALVLLLQILSRKRGLESLEVSMTSQRYLAEPEEAFELVITLTNRSRGFLPFLRLGFRLPNGMQTTLTSRQTHLTLLDREEVTLSTWIAPMQQANIRVPVVAKQRGIYAVDELVIMDGDFLGLHEDRHVYPVKVEVVVCPKAAPEQSMTKLPGSFPGDISVRRFLFEDPIFITGFQEYTGREPMRSIAWNATARTGQLMAKQYDHTVEVSVAVVLNLSTESYRASDLAEQCFSLCRTACRQLEDQGIRYRVYTNAMTFGGFSFQEQVMEGLGEHHFRLVLEGLGRCDFRASGSAEMLMETAARRSYNNCGILFITPDRNPHILAAAQRCAGRSGVSLLTLIGEECGA